MEQEHKTDGTPCWCNPRVVKVKANKEMQNKCKSLYLQYLNERKNLSVNGCKDSQYNDLIMFEKYSQNEHIILTEWNWEKDYIYIIPVGIYSSIDMLAKKLRNILPYDKPISCIEIGDNLNIHVDILNPNGYTSYECRRIDFDQKGKEHTHEGWKMER